jgi:hypothetical protein
MSTKKKFPTLWQSLIKKFDVNVFDICNLHVRCYVYTFSADSLHEENNNDRLRLEAVEKPSCATAARYLLHRLCIQIVIPCENSTYLCAWQLKVLLKYWASFS